MTLPLSRWLSCDGGTVTGLARYLGRWYHLSLTRKELTSHFHSLFELYCPRWATHNVCLGREHTPHPLGLQLSLPTHPSLPTKKGKFFGFCVPKLYIEKKIIFSPWSTFFLQCHLFLSRMELHNGLARVKINPARKPWPCFGCTDVAQVSTT